MSENYLRKYTTHGRVALHRYIWERANGPIPKGFILHHKNKNKKDNRLENLELMPRNYHGKIHQGQQYIEGVWWIVCPVCKINKPESDYYTNSKSACKICKSNKRGTEYRTKYTSIICPTCGSKVHKNKILARNFDRFI